MDLEAYRQSANLTFDRLAELMGVKSVSQMRRLALGEELLRDHRLERAIEISGGKVTAYAVHQRRMAFLRKRPGGVGPHLGGTVEVEDDAADDGAAERAAVAV